MLTKIALFLGMLAVPFASAHPTLPRRPAPLPGNFLKVTGCDISKATIPLPATAAGAGISVPAGQKPVFLMLGRGVQNYTCTNGTYGTNMAVATLFDASCAFNTPIYTTLTQLALKIPFNPKVTTSTLGTQVQGLIGQLKLGNHYFQKLSPTVASANPVFDLRSSGRDFVAVSKLAAVPSPTDATKNVAWVELTAVAGQGSLGSTVFRVETAGGQPPSTVSGPALGRTRAVDSDALKLQCTTEGDIKTVDYAALYWVTK